MDFSTLDWTNIDGELSFHVATAPVDGNTLSKYCILPENIAGELYAIVFPERPQQERFSITLKISSEVFDKALELLSKRGWRPVIHRSPSGRGEFSARLHWKAPEEMLSEATHLMVYLPDDVCSKYRSFDGRRLYAERQTLDWYTDHTLPFGSGFDGLRQPMMNRALYQACEQAGLVGLGSLPVSLEIQDSEDDYKVLEVLTDEYVLLVPTITLPPSRNGHTPGKNWAGNIFPPLLKWDRTVFDTMEEFDFAYTVEKPNLFFGEPYPDIIVSQRFRRLLLEFTKDYRHWHLDHPFRCEFSPVELVDH
jgi:hypothetical protein